jgi:two-component system, NarL family, nitrate/nitrite response regulator NarL
VVRRPLLDDLVGVLRSSSRLRKPAITLPRAGSQRVDHTPSSVSGNPMAVAQIRVFLISDVRLYREALADVLDSRDGVELLGTARSAEEAPIDLPGLAPDVVLLDPAAGDGLAAVKSIGDTGLSVVVLAIPDVESEILLWAEAGASGFVTRDQSFADLISIVESTTRGEMPGSPRLTAALVGRIRALARERTAMSEASLTPREAEIADLIDQGLSNKEIARHLCIEVPTVKTHVHNILEKLQVHRRGQAAAWLRDHRSTR